jgi:heat shock protein HtpX
MWEAIRRNTRRSWMIIGLMALILAGLGALIGAVFGGGDGIGFGLAFAIGAWLILLTVTLAGGEGVILYTAGAREILKDDAPQLWNVVEEMTIASGLGRMPRVFIQSGYMLNAFAVGRSTETACVVVTEGLIRNLDRDELQGVVAHEIGHIKNLDVRFMTIAAVMVGSITMLAESCRRILWFGGGRRTRSRGGQEKVVFLALLVVASILAPLAARLLYLACSRQREFLADASAARFTRYPEGLASALVKISKRTGVTGMDRAGAIAPMYIVNPVRQQVSATSWFRTHPPTDVRVRILRSMGGNAGWADYERAYRAVEGGAGLLPGGLTGEAPIPVRAPGGDVDQDHSRTGLSREVTDALDRQAGLVVIPCSCGVRIKVPEAFPKDWLYCTRCGARHDVPAAQPEAGAVVTENGSLRFERPADGWNAFRCACGKVLYASPALRVSTMRCTRCGRSVEVT